MVCSKPILPFGSSSAEDFFSSALLRELLEPEQQTLLNSVNCWTFNLAEDKLVVKGKQIASWVYFRYLNWKYRKGEFFLYMETC